MKSGFFYRLLGLFLNALNSITPVQGGKLGFKYFCSPARPQISKKQFDFLRTAVESDILFKGNKIRQYKWGNGPKKILFIHGWQSFSFRWKEYIDLLLSTDEYTIMAYDAPAHGQSQGKRFTVPENAALIEQVLNNVGEVDAVVTHSIGSFSFFYAFAKHKLPPVNKLVALSTPGSAIEFIGYYRQVLKLKPYTVKNITAEFEAFIQEDLNSVNLPNLVKDLTIPGLIIHDQKDGLTDFSNARLLHQHWPQSELMTTTGLGHRLRSPEVINAVVAFIKE
ncbi:alpha/beta hydrolase [Cyclobacterium sp. 1_MG-2023]|uniref:alpha/beta fold hydrolase n=1 Tax=Cyclobacterium sp. 1_MG-2023 TaxID=3062681 RepID=UPI0026E1331C|nr:alpha/beta hydrolase [Cyclobacterium sp. 1_MG-2023]MDO6440151.1 alpha/beta hydrolase [Cyclobacterium sp. 1_MG-2023]